MRAYELIRRLPSYRNHSLSPLSPQQLPGYLTAFGLVAIAFLIRWAFDEQLPSGFPFLTFFPAIVLVAFTVGIWPGILAAVLGFFLSWYFFIPPVASWTLNAGTATALAFYVFVSVIDLLLMNMALTGFANVDRTARENKEMAEFQSLLIRELDHRIKNLFSVVSAVVKLTAREVKTPAELADVASSRIMALGRSHSALWQVGKQSSTTFEGVARQVLEPYLESHGDLITISSHMAMDDIRHVQIMTLILHELATNSAKYGSLSSGTGGITISAEEQESDPPAMLFVWTERSAAALAPSGEGSGFGTEMISRLAASAGGKFLRTFEHGQLVASAVLPLR